ncbi:cytidylyltransferase domain-containing protein [Puia sp.]|jgi:spore coat polysaccharide biosynthesis protein SpsF|uniref:cytidylyltransferase domain-containing protein n=1 Tax=Puia sp. TaxID=2045100 RepID=UPI002F409A43
MHRTNRIKKELKHDPLLIFTEDLPSTPATPMVHARVPLIVQARMQSTRYPGKVLKPFAEGRSLLEFQLVRLKQAFPGSPIVIATSNTAADDPIAQLAKAIDVFCYRGEERDVLKRFVNACRYFGFNRQIIRICGDNPFLQMEFLSRLMEEAAEESDADDYIGFSINRIPAIRTHFGFFAELVAVDALLHVYEHVEDPVFHEHVTNYIYESTGTFKIRLLEVQSLIPFLECLRLTVDSREDFENAVYIYRQLHPSSGQADPSWKDIMDFVGNDPAIKGRMTQQIRLYTK